MFEKLIIQSHKGSYTVFFGEEFLENPSILFYGTPHFLIDAKVAELYKKPLSKFLENQSTLIIEATEENKSLEKIIPIIEKLVYNNVRRDHFLIAIGGGILQDITCFIASTLLRGLNWKFVPTTLLAQSDSCIGSKSSINLGSVKNILGTFNPPSEIYVSHTFLETLELQEIRSGIGEVLKVHAIDGVNSFDRLADDFASLHEDQNLLKDYTRNALLIKQKYIEKDEFDRGVRNIFNYGHSFGHAIESATEYKVPHGIAVTMGMDVANHIAVLRGLMPERHYNRMHPVLHANYLSYANEEISQNLIMKALMKDKKNTSSKLTLILPHGENAKLEKIFVTPDQELRRQCKMAFELLAHDPQN